MFFSSQKVEGDGAVTNDTEKGDEDEKEVEGDGDEVEGDNEGGEEAGAAEEKALNENLGDEGDCCLHSKSLFHFLLKPFAFQETMMRTTTMTMKCESGCYHRTGFKPCLIYMFLLEV